MSLFSLYIRVLKALGPQRRAAAIIALANVFVAAASFAVPILFGWIIDLLTAATPQADGTRHVEHETLALYVGIWIAMALFNIGASVWVAFHSDRLKHTRMNAMMAEFFEHVLSLPQAFHTQKHSGSLLKIMFSGCDSMAEIWLSFFRENLNSFLILFVMLPLSVFLNWQLALILIALVISFSALAIWVRRKTEKQQKEVEHLYVGIAQTTGDALGNVPVIQSFTRIGQEVQHMRDVGRRLLDTQMPVLFWWAVVAVATQASSMLTILGILIVGTMLYLNGQTTIGEIVTFVSFATLLIGRLEQVVAFVNRLFLSAPRLRQFFEILDIKPSIANAPDAIDPGRLKGEVVFDDVRYSYDGKRNAIDGVSIRVKPGETIALVGETGSGKSTAIGLVYRAFDPTSGHVRIDGHDLRSIKLEALRRNIGVVFQEPMLFARSIRDNVQIGDEEADDVRLDEALAAAQAIDFVDRQSDGMETIIGERGRTLSGGERQRLSIARAILKDPPIMILDEATAALDAATERKLQKALDAMRQNRTTFVIAHRLATIRNADRILVFDKGRIIEHGSFDELITRNGQFAALARAQFLVEEDA
jgi:ATP-binding cassette, subfamily B, beta-glucan exporter